MKKKTPDDHQLNLTTAPHFDRAVPLLDPPKKSKRMPAVGMLVSIKRGLYENEVGEVMVRGRGFVVLHMDNPEIPPMTCTDSSAFDVIGPSKHSAIQISNLTEPVEAYRQAVDGARSREDLLRRLMPFRRIANDAIEAARAIDDWKDFRRGLIAERRRRFAGETWAKRYLPIVLPVVLVQVSEVARKFHAPWGVTFLRMVEIGRIVERDDVAYLRNEHDGP